eukprot:SAG31_NODE_3_length_45830_cov_42.279701_38_plen_159_part_00
MPGSDHGGQPDQQGRSQVQGVTLMPPETYNQLPKDLDGVVKPEDYAKPMLLEVVLSRGTIGKLVHPELWRGLALFVSRHPSPPRPSRGSRGPEGGATASSTGVRAGPRGGAHSSCPSCSSTAVPPPPPPSSSSRAPRTSQPHACRDCGASGTSTQSST